MSRTDTARSLATRLFFALAFALFFASNLSAQTFGPGLQDTLDGLAPTDQIEVVVTYDQDGPLTTTQRLALQSTGVVGITMNALPMAGVLATPAQVNAIASLSGVRSLWPNYALTYDNDAATDLTGVDAARTDEQFRTLNGGLPLSGRGIGVLINDSGVDGTHPDLSNQMAQNVAGQTNLHAYSALLPNTWTEGIPNTDIGGGHGTHVAGIVAANGSRSGGLYEGVAPGVDLIGYGSGATLALLDVLGGFDYALVNHQQYNIRVITNSWGNTDDAGTDFNPEDPTNIATKALADLGVIVVFSAGNSGPNDDTISGNFKKAPWVITVAAGDDAGNLAGFSSRGEAGNGGTVVVDGETFTWEDRPTITAPGVSIVSTRATGGITVGAIFDPTGEILIPPAYLPYYTSLNGTSMACPHAAGIAALMLEADPSLTVYDIRGIFENTATEMIGSQEHEVGKGYVNAYASAAAAFGLDPAPYLREPFGDDDGDDPTSEGGEVLTDEEGDALVAGADITHATVGNEDAATFDVTLHINDLDAATPSTLIAAGLQVGAIQEYSTEFVLEKEGEASVRYILSAKRPLVNILGGSAVGIEEASFEWGVRAANGSGRFVGDFDGIWDAEAGTITWIVNKSDLNVAAAPADLTADIDRSGRPAQDGDRLTAFTADVALSLWGGVVGLTPGQTQYDAAVGTGSYTLGNPPDDEPDPDPDPDPNPDRKQVRPLFECAGENEDGTFTAYFNYRNINDFTVDIPIGDANRVAPAPEDRGQPTTFETGKHSRVLAAIFEDNLSWTLDGRTRTAEFGKQVCRTADLSLDLTADNTAPDAGSEITFTVTVTNAGSATARYVNVSVPLPAAFDFVSAEVDANTHDSYDASTGIWQARKIKNGQQAELTLTVTANNSATMTAEIESVNTHDPDSAPGNGDPAEDDYAALTVDVQFNEPRVVVSVIDSGINPYHAFFNAGSEIYADAAPSSVTQEVLDAFGIDADHTLSLTRTGDFNADFAADAALWAGVNPGELYWFEGTNIIAISYDAGSRIIMPDDEEDTHGVGTSAAMLRANPEAILVFVEGVTDASETFAFTHPEIDIVSTSYGAIGSIPLPYHINDSYTGVVENGKLHFGAADNSPSTAIQDGTAGPWWSIGVAGFEEEDSEGKQLLSGTLPDFVGDFYQTLPYCASCEDGQRGVGGTSFATPRSAGTMSKILLETRRAYGHLGGIVDTDGTPVMVSGENGTVSNWQLRRALEEAAYIPTVDEYDPQQAAFDLLGVPVPPAGAYALVGWGAITPETEHEVISQALAHLGVSGDVTRTKSDDTCTFMTSVVTARHAYWDNLAIESQSFLIGGDDPYLYCGQETSSRLAAGPLEAETFEAVPGSFELGQNYPNPFNPSTQISFALPEQGPVRLEVYNMLGQRVRTLVDAEMSAGSHTVTFEARDLASGTYLYRLETAAQTETRRMVLVK